jgi:biopolymer transport protein ExbD
MAMTTATGDGRAMSAINVTPMADIMIVLLIIFMVMTPLLDEGGVKLPAASNAAHEKPAADDIVVSIRADTTMSLGDDRLDNLGELALKLNEQLDSRAEGGRVVYLRADEGLPYSSVWQVLEVCREAGANEIALLSRQQIGG